MQLPESMEDLVYWTSRKIGEGNVKAWVYREKCPECGNALVGKPRNDKGKVKIRAKHYECPECSFRMDKEEYEETLTANILYKCPKCNAEGEAQVPYIRKKVAILDPKSQKKKSVSALVFHCKSCDEKIPITKKMK